MKEITDKLSGGTIPGPGNYEADEYNTGMKRDILSLVKLANITPNENNFLQVSDAVARLGITSHAMVQDPAFTPNNYVLNFDGYTGNIDPATNPTVSQQFNGPTDIKKGSLIHFQPLNSSSIGIDSKITINGTSIVDVNIQIPTMASDAGPTIFRSADQDSDIRTNEYVLAVFDGSSFIIVTKQWNDVIGAAIRVSRKVPTGTGNAIILTSIAGTNQGLGLSSTEGYLDGETIEWNSASGNTGAVTINLDTRGTVALVDGNGDDLLRDELTFGESYAAWYAAGIGKFVLFRKRRITQPEFMGSYKQTGFSQGGQTQYTVSKINGPNPTDYIDGMVVSFAPLNNLENTQDNQGGTVRLIIEGLAVSREIVNRQGIRPSPNTITTQDAAFFVYNAITQQFTYAFRNNAYNKFDYDQSSLYISFANGESTAVGQATTGLFIVQPNAFSKLGPTVLAPDGSSGEIRTGTRISFRGRYNNTFPGGLGVRLRLAIDAGLPIGTYPNIYSDATILSLDGQDIRSNEIAADRLVELMFISPNWYIVNSNRAGDRLDSMTSMSFQDDLTSADGNLYNLNSTAGSPIRSYIDGQIINVRLETTNSVGFPQFNLDGLGTRGVRNSVEGSIPIGSMQSGFQYSLRYFAGSLHFRTIDNEPMDTTHAGVGRVATTFEVQQGTSNSSVVTPFNLQDSFARTTQSVVVPTGPVALQDPTSPNTNSVEFEGIYTELTIQMPGFIIKFGKNTAAYKGDIMTNQVFLTPFPNTLDFVITSSLTGPNESYSGGNAKDTDTNVQWAQFLGFDKTNFWWRGQWSGTGINLSTFSYIAYGT